MVLFAGTSPHALTLRLLPEANVTSRKSRPCDHARLSVEHPAGALEVEVELDASGTPPKVLRAGVVRTARKLFDGLVFPR